MARGVRFTKPERELIRSLINAWTPCEPTKKVHIGYSVLDKLKESEEPEQKSKGLPVQVAIEAFKEALGNRLVLPPNGAGAVYGLMGKRLAALNLSRQDCLTCAKQAAVEWRGPVKAQSIINQAETLMHNAQLSFDGLVPADDRMREVSRVMEEL